VRDSTSGEIMQFTVIAPRHATTQVIIPAGPWEFTAIPVPYVGL
jgi:hypothetical protein